MGIQGGAGTAPLPTTDIIDMRTLCDSFNADLPMRPIVYWFTSERRFEDTGSGGGFYTGAGTGNDDS